MRRSFYLSAYGLGVILFLLSGWLWWSKVSLNPERVFWGTVAQGLNEPGATLHIEQQNKDSKADQLIQFKVGAQSSARALSTVTQGKDRARSEIIGTPDADYSRYQALHIDNQKNQHGQPLNFSPVLGLWGKSEHLQSSQSKAGQQLLPQVLLGVGLPFGAVPMPIGQVPSANRAELLRQIRDEKVYAINFSTVKKQHVDGRLQYVYHASIAPAPYVHYLQNFGRALGLHDLDQINPGDYQGTQPMVVDLTIDARARQLVVVGSQKNGYRETYSGHGLTPAIAIPAHAISIAELQSRLRDVQ
jgi:hypothetical protein